MSEAKAPVAGGHSGGLRVVLVALVINLLIALFKFIAAGFSGSTAMPAEAATPTESTRPPSAG